MYNKSYKIRLYPTKEQEELMWKHVHACRFVWNYFIDLNSTNYKNGIKKMSGYDMIRNLKNIKKENGNEWLSEVSNASLSAICRDVDKAYIMFFKGVSNYPKFKSKKRSKNVFPVRHDSYKAFHFEDDSVKVEKIGKIKIKPTNIPLNCKYINPRISYIGNKWILAVGIECENQTLDLTNKSMGIDLGIKELAVVSYGEDQIVFHNINKSKRVKTLEHKLKHISRVINRKYRTNKSYDKTNGILKYERIQKEIYYKLHNIRLNYIHQTTHNLISMKPRRVVMEDLNVIGMMKNHNLAKSISDQRFAEFIRQMKYKCEWNNIEFVQADRFYPSSKTCSCCGSIKPILKLKDRVYKCEDCGLVIDRDYNAAINLMNYVV